MAGLNFSLDDVKNALGVTGTFQDATLQVYFDDVVDFLLDAGVSSEFITSGIVARGVSDLWNYGSAGGVLSQYFIQRASQLALKKSKGTAADYTPVTHQEIDTLFDGGEQP